MDWLQVRITVPGRQHDLVGDWLLERGALSITLLDAADQPILEPAPGETPVWEEVVLVALFDKNVDLDKICSEISQSWPELSGKIQKDRLPDRVWETAWMDHFEPMQFGEQLWVVPSWAEPPVPDAVNIFLDPGLAFGSGTHETTALCLEWLSRQSLQEQTVLDYGCGSGILGIAAAKLGARQVLGVDVDPQAIIASQDNARKNGVTEQTRWQLIDGNSPPIIPPHDILLANILAEPLRKLAPIFAHTVRPEGQIALSGLLRTQCQGLLSLYDDYFVMNPPITKGDWALLTGYRRH